MKHEGWAGDAIKLGIHLSEDQWGALERYESLLLDVAVPRGTISPGDRGRLWERHIADGLRAANEIGDGALVADIGSGAGVPGIPLAVARPGSRFTLIEPRGGRVAFLETVIGSLGLSNVRVFKGRAEKIQERFDVAVARALAPAAQSWGIAAELLKPAGLLIYWAGKGFDVSEVADIGVSVRVSTRSGLADEGPLVIMAPR